MYRKGALCRKPQRRLCGSKHITTLCVFCCQCVCKSVCVWGGVPTKVCLSICETICLCVRETVYAKGNCQRRRMRSSPEPASINNPHMLWWPHTHRPEPASRGTLEKCLCATSETFLFWCDYYWSLSMFSFHSFAYRIMAFCIICCI